MTVTDLPQEVVERSIRIITISSVLNVASIPSLICKDHQVSQTSKAMDKSKSTHDQYQTIGDRMFRGTTSHIILQVDRLNTLSTCLERYSGLETQALAWNENNASLQQ